MKLNRSSKLCFISILLTVIVGCSSYSKPQQLEHGYLSDYQRLTEIKDTNGFIQDRWVSPKLMKEKGPIEPISFYVKPVVFFPKFDEQNQFMRSNADKILSYLTIKTRQIVAEYFPVTTKPTHGTFIIEPAITQVKISQESLKPTELLPVGTVIAIGKHLLGTRDRDIEIRLENKVILADTNELLATTVLRGNGEQLENDKEQLSLKHLKPILDTWIAQWKQEIANYKKIIDKRHADSSLNINAVVSS